ncbi:MAG: thioredoxin [Chitinophagaceae bacterium]|jgi:thioredoxin 1|nr:thioredoxin [Chitinophagaceae bacterium]
MQKIFLFFIAASFTFGCSNNQPQGNASPVDAKTFSKKIAHTPNAQILDVRTPEEFDKGHLENAININWNSSDFFQNLSEIKKSRPVFVYCLGGGRSAAAVAKLREEGFKKVYDMKGGFMAWNAAGLPSTTQKTLKTKGLSLIEYGNLMKDSSKLVLVDFYADWCGPCKKMAPFIKKIAQEKNQILTLVKINVDDNMELCTQLGIEAIPVLKLYKNKMVVWQSEGYINENMLRESIEKAQQ